ncbi:2,5-dichloro-2,5-cyclohexadiene-1,4-diol dehydrogenase [Luminiphilus syltensis NOR5-1B]|uniref:2,5-dichloro-2,5-cyclohexadiene-1,4-diol dehydrogenase n=1 Tax=Luminiphilus syltensis NOR5-1B TaxID=565045 RepID=B8KV58_9GAMM|nr:SDR family NAD(P)-dependent oxidoreductase [Luminiphilus syltensis]EED34412.1 2,5-dichloro-2,5-cyclohexadiene-1,4-diol dehydrogenase [Luminiphilus syltensis NOR5-1B]
MDPSNDSALFAGRTVLVTGGASGIGQATAHAFANRGARVGIIDTADTGDIDEEVSRLKAHGIDAAGTRADIANAQQVAHAIALLSEALGPIDTLVNNAGIWEPNPVPESPLQLFDQHIDVNVKGTFHVTQACLPAMLERGRGVIVNVSSVSGIAGRAGDSAYSTSKAAVGMLTRTLAAELGPKGIRINCIAPGAVATPLTAGLRTPEGESAIAALMATHPSPNGRFFIDPEDMADIILFLCSDASKAIHGAVIPADEGLTAVM